MVLLYVLIALALLVLIGAYAAYFYAFRSGCRSNGIFNNPQYAECSERIDANVAALRAMEWEDMYITSFDGLKLHAYYHQGKADAPIGIFFHGYRSVPFLDGSGGGEICREKDYSMLLVDQRGLGKSEGHVITMGVKEMRDCVDWVNYAVDRFGEDVKLMLLGVSMGAATVVMASGLGLPSNVRCILADCGFSSPRAILRSVIKDMKLPEELSYFLVRLGGRLFGGFDTEAASAVELTKQSKTPTLFIHGEKDTFVPTYMSKEMYDACGADKKLVIIERAIHGMSYYVDNPAYREACEWLLEKL